MYECVSDKDCHFCILTFYTFANVTFKSNRKITKLKGYKSVQNLNRNEHFVKCYHVTSKMIFILCNNIE